MNIVISESHWKIIWWLLYWKNDIMRGVKDEL